MSRHRVNRRWLALYGFCGAVCLGVVGLLTYRAVTDPQYLPPDELWGFVIFMGILVGLGLGALAPFRVAVELYPDSLVRNGPLGRRMYRFVEFSGYRRVSRRMLVHPLPVSIPVVAYVFYDRAGKRSGLSLRNNLDDFSKVAVWVEERFRKLE